MNCVACGGEMGDAATRCPSCGLAFAAADAPPPPAAPAHVGLYLGSIPEPLAAAPGEEAPAERETPPAPAGLPHAERRWRTLVAVLGAAAVLAATAAVLSLRRKPDGYDLDERLFARFTDSARLDPVEAPAVPDAVAADAVPGTKPRPLPAAGGGSLHDFFGAFVGQLVDIDPERAMQLGMRPRPPRPASELDAAEAEETRLYRDADRALRSWPGAERLSPHDRADREALLAVVETRLAWRATPELTALAELTAWLDPLQRLADIPTWPAEERAAIATATLDDLPARIARSLAALTKPPRAAVLATASQLADADAYLSSYAASWHGAGAPAALRDAVAGARDAVGAAVARLRSDVLARASGELGVGRENVALLLRTRHRLPMSARDAYVRALDEVHAAHADMRRLWPSLRGQAGGIRDVQDDVQVKELRAACDDWVPSMPASERVVLVQLPRALADRHVAATYEDAGTLSDADAGVVHVSPPRAAADDTDRGYFRLVRRHTLAHETYPGHRLEHVFRRGACELRRFVDDRVFVEGWAVYAQDLIHETRHCDGGPCDEFVCAALRASHAHAAMMDLLAATGAATDEEIAALMRASGWPAAGVEDVGARTSSTCYALTYLLGRDEIVGLRRSEESRRGTAFDLRAFHAKLLAEGPIPPPLIAEEWRETAR